MPLLLTANTTYLTAGPGCIWLSQVRLLLSGGCTPPLNVNLPLELTFIPDFPFTRLKNIISPYDINELTEITLNNQEFSTSRHFFENLHENTFFMPHLSSNPCFCTDLDRSPLHKFKFSAILGINRKPRLRYNAQK